MTRSEHRDGVGATMTDGDDGTPDRSAAPNAHNPAEDPTTPTVPAEALLTLSSCASTLRYTCSEISENAHLQWSGSH